MLMNGRIFILILLTLLWVHQGYARLSKKVFIRNYTVDNGLPQNSVNDILQDDQGYIWISTSGGLRRTDGVRFLDFSGPDGNLINNLHNADLRLDARGDVWILSHLLIAVYSPSNSRLDVIERSSADPTDYLILLSPTRSDQIKYYRKKHGLFEIDCRLRKTTFLGARQFAFLSPPSELIAIQQPDTGIFIYNHDNSIYVLDLKTYTEQQWTCKGLMPTYEGSGQRTYLDDYTREVVLQILQSRGNNVHDYDKYKFPSLVVSDTNVVLYDPFSNNEGCHWKDMSGKQFSTGITSYRMIKDMRGNYWIASLNTGLWHIDVTSNPFTILAGSEGAGIFAKGIIYDKIHDCIVATFYNGGFAIYDRTGRLTGDHTSFRNGARLTGHNVINCLQTDSFSYLLIVQEPPYSYRVNLKEKVVDPVNIFEMPKDEDFSFYASAKEIAPFEYAICSRHNVYNLNKHSGALKVTKIFSSPSMLGGLYVHRRQLYVGSNGGYDILDFTGALLKHIALPGNPEALVKDFYTAADNTMYVATTIGLYTYRDKQGLKLVAGLPDNYIYNILPDGQHNLWLSSNKGIIAYDLSTGLLRHFSSADGLASNECNTNCLCALPDRQMIVGTISGLWMFNPQVINQAEPPYTPVITGISTSGPGLKPDTIDAGSIALSLPFNRNKISLSFSDMSYTPPEQAVYRYRYTGNDTSWQYIYSGFEFTISPQPGSYTLELQAGNKKIAKFSDSRLLSIVIAPPFWQTPWFYSLELLVLICVVYLSLHLLHQKKIRSMMRQLQLQQALQSERERISRELHDNLGAQATTLNANLRELESFATNHERRETVAKVSEMGKSIMQNLRESIWALNNEQIAVTNLYDRYKLFARNIVRSFPGIKISFTENIASEVILKPTTALNILRILQEALHNTLKHASASEINVTFSTVAGLEITYADNGIGFATQEPGAGESYGLKNMRIRAEEAGVKLKIENGFQKGMKLTITEIKHHEK